MNKGELIEAISKGANIQKHDADKVVNCITNTIVTTVYKGGRLTIKDFGSFYVVNTPERTRRNPQTGATVKVKAGKAAKFKVGKAFLADLCS